MGMGDQIMTNTRRVMSIIADHTAHPVAEAATFTALDIDELDVLEIVLDLEYYMGIEIRHGQEENWTSVKDVIDAVDAALKEAL